MEKVMSVVRFFIYTTEVLLVLFMTGVGVAAGGWIGGLIAFILTAASFEKFNQKLRADEANTAIIEAHKNK